MPAKQAVRQPMIRRWHYAVVVLGTVIAMSLIAVPVMRAEHEGTNLLQFAAVDGSPSPRASGSGFIRYRGGAEPESRWTSTFEFTDLEPDTPYIVLVMGRTGADGSAAVQAFSPICGFRADATGTGLCWDYELGMQRLGVVQLRRDDEARPVVLQATRGDDGPGEIDSAPNQFSPTTPVPLASPPSPSGSPRAG